MKFLCSLAVASTLFGCSKEVYVTQNGIIKCQYDYDGEYNFDSIRVCDITNGCKEVVITLKKGN